MNCKQCYEFHSFGLGSFRNYRSTNQAMQDLSIKSRSTDQSRFTTGTPSLVFCPQKPSLGFHVSYDTNCSRKNGIFVILYDTYGYGYVQFTSKRNNLSCRSRLYSSYLSQRDFRMIEWETYSSQPYRPVIGCFTLKHWEAISVLRCDVRIRAASQNRQFPVHAKTAL